MKQAPWRDYFGSVILDGDVIQHPTGERGVVVFLKDEADPGDQWRVRYDDGPLSRLCLQIGDKGRAFVVERNGEHRSAALPVDPRASVSMNVSPNTFCFVAPSFRDPPTGEPMLKIAEDGFWVRGEKVPQGESEARTVYGAFVAWLRATGQRV